MSEFFNVLPPDQALQLLKRHLSLHIETEFVSTTGALGRVTAKDIQSPEDLPAFPRSTMDGYSVRAVDTFGASEGLPAYLNIVGKMSMGQASQISLRPGQAAEAYTGSMLAKDADAVVIVENTQIASDNTIEVFHPVAPGENVINPGEDVQQGAVVIQTQHLMRPQDIGGLLALGITQIEVGRQPRVSIISTGDELVPPEDQPSLGQVRDINTYTISALVTQAGGVPIPMALVKDDYEAQRNAAIRGLDQGDILVFSAGSSVSSRDMTASIINSLGSPGVLAHGISLKPGKPTVIGLVDEKPALGLPGNPVSAMVVFDLLVRPTIYMLSGCTDPPTIGTVQANLTRDIPSQAGREDYIQVSLEYRTGSINAEPVFGKSNLIYTMIHAHGTIKIPLDKSGLYAGEEVTVKLY